MWPFLGDLMNSVAYSLIGFTIGWLLGYEARSLNVILNVLRGDNEVESREDASMTKTHTSPLGRVGYVVVVLSLLTILQSAYFSYSQRQTSECLSDYNESFSKVYDLRSKFAELDRQALTRFLDVYQQSPPPNKRERFRALLTMRSDYARTSELREHTPFPALEACD